MKLPFTEEQRAEIAQAAQTAGASDFDAFLEDVQAEIRRMSGADLVKPKEKKRANAAE